MQQRSRKRNKNERTTFTAGPSLNAVRPADGQVLVVPEGWTFKAVFGETEESHRALSPVADVAKGKNIPSFLILHVVDRPDTKAQSE